MDLLGVQGDKEGVLGATRRNRIQCKLPIQVPPFPHSALTTGSLSLAGTFPPEATHGVALASLAAVWNYMVPCSSGVQFVLPVKLQLLEVPAALEPNRTGLHISQFTTAGFCCCFFEVAHK